MQVAQKNITEQHIAEGIYLYRNALTDELCDSVYSFYYDNIGVAKEGQTSGGYMPETKKTLDFMTNTNLFTGEKKETFNSLDKQIYQSLNKAIQMYQEKYEHLKKCTNMVDTGYLWQMYRANEGYYKEHVDGDQWTHSVSDRILAVVIYINSVEEGGETYFRIQNVSVKPEKGTICIFPAHWQYPHQAMVPISSDKLIISSFVVSPK